MQKKKYVLKYEIFLEGAEPIKDKEIKISNCFNEFNAKVRLGDYLKKKYKNFKNLVVTECKEDYDLGGIFGDQFGDQFGDLFAGGNLFGSN